MIDFPDIFSPEYYQTGAASSIVIIQACLVAFVSALIIAALAWRSSLKSRSATFFWCGMLAFAYALWNIFFLSSYAQRDISVAGQSLSVEFTYRAYLAVGALIPSFAHACLRRIYYVRYLISNRLHALTIFVALICLFAPLPEYPIYFTLACGLFTFLALGFINTKIWKRFSKSTDPRFKTRSLFLGIGMSLSLFFSLLGQLRAEGILPLPLPYFGNILTVVFLYFVYQMIENPRLRDVRELMLRGIRILLLTAVLSVIFVSLLSWVGENNPELFLFNTFLASFIILNVLEPIRDQLDRYILRRFIIDRYELEKIVRSVLRNLRKSHTTDQLISVLLNGIRSSDRIYQTGIYLWDPATQNYRLTSKSNLAGPSTLAADHPIATYFAETHSPALKEQPEDAKSTELLRSLRSHVALPIYQAERVTAIWLIRSSLSSSNPFTSFSSAEIRLLQRLAKELATLLEHSRFYEKQDQQQRLAALGEMSAALAHEIRNPLGAIQGATLLLDTSGTIKDEEDLECIQILKSEIDRLQQTVNQYLHFARRTDHMIDTSLNTLIVKSIGAAKQKSQKTHTQIHFDTDSPPLLLSTDPLKLEQVLINLIENACEAFSKNVWVELRADSTKISISVKDDGPGIPSDVLPNIFTPLFTTKRAGSGLGLPICKKIIDSLGGELSIRSRTNEGTEFKIKFTRKEREANTTVEDATSDGKNTDR